MNQQVRIIIEMFTLFFIVVGALNWGFVGLFKFNLVEYFATKTFKHMDTVIYVIVGISAVIHIFHRDYYLPFLGHAAFPCEAITEKFPLNANIDVKVSVAPNVNVIFWAAETNDKVMENPWMAYDLYSNSGVTRSDASGDVVLKVRNPAAYKTPGIIRRTLPIHVHYRTCSSAGMLSPVKTINV